MASIIRIGIDYYVYFNAPSSIMLNEYMVSQNRATTIACSIALNISRNTEIAVIFYIFYWKQRSAYNWQ